MKEQVYEKSWGRETWFANNDKYCGKLLMVRPDCWSSNGRFHYHKIKDETFFVIAGRLRLDYQDLDGIFYRIEIPEGGSFRVPSGMRHRFCGSGSYCEFIEVSTKHMEEDSYRCEWDQEKEEWIEQ